MPQEDHLKRKLDQFAKALAKLLMRLNGMKDAGVNTSESIKQLIDETLKRESSLSTEQLLGLPEENFVSQLNKQFPVNNDHLELLSEIFWLLSVNHQEEKKILKRLHSMLNHLNETGRIYSLERHYRIEQIKQRLASDEGTRRTTA